MNNPDQQNTKSTAPDATNKESGPRRKKAGQNAVGGKKNAPLKKKRKIQKSLANKKKVKAIEADYTQPDPKVLAAKARARRHKRSRKLYLKLAFAVVLPTLLAALYYMFEASDIYQSSTTFTIQTSQMKPDMGLETLLGGIGASGSSKDSWTVHEYMVSREMLEKLDEEFNILDHYKNEQHDIWSRLSKDASFEDAHDYFKKMVEVEYDTSSGILTLSLKAYSPDKAKKYTQAILEYAEKMVNKMSSRIQNDQIDFALAAVDKAEERLAVANQKVLKLQRENDEFNPDRAATAVMTVQGQLESDLAKAKAELNSARAVMAPTAPQVIALSQKVQSLKQIIKKERAKLVGGEGSNLGSSIVDFESAMTEKGFAQTEYASAMKSLEMAKLEASRKSRYLAVISSPSLPDEATYPTKGMNIVTVFLIAMALYGISSLLIAAIREHARI